MRRPRTLAHVIGESFAAALVGVAFGYALARHRLPAETFATLWPLYAGLGSVVAVLSMRLVRLIVLAFRRPR